MEPATSGVSPLMTRPLRGIHGAMEMPTAFTGGADFSGTNGTILLFFRDRIHKIFTGVNEKGTRAVAGTAAGLVYYPSEYRVPVATCRTDLPMIFQILYNETVPILFRGLVVSPGGLTGSEALA